MHVLILDLDHTLICTTYSPVKEKPLVAHKGYHYLYHRPNLLQDLHQWNNTYQLVFYTSSKANYARWVINTFHLPEGSWQLLTRKHCKAKHTRYGTVYYKRISVVLSQFPTPPSSIHIMDDRPDLWVDAGEATFIDVERYHID